MLYVFHKVEIVRQEKTHSCWHSSASVIWRYWQKRGRPAGPINTFTDIYSNNAGLPLVDNIAFAKKAGMVALPISGFSGTKFTPADLHAYLKTCGPIWCAGSWWGNGHIIILTGLLDDTLYFADVANGGHWECSLDWFNSKTRFLPGALLAGVPNLPPRPVATSNALTASLTDGNAPPLPQRQYVRRSPPLAPRSHTGLAPLPEFRYPPPLPPRESAPPATPVPTRLPPPLPYRSSNAALAPTRLPPPVPPRPGLEQDQQ